jgi:hypothetical protein
MQSAPVEITISCAVARQGRKTWRAKEKRPEKALKWSAQIVCIKFCKAGRPIRLAKRLHEADPALLH